MSLNEAELENAYEMLWESLHREPTEDELDDYLQRLEVEAESRAYDIAEAEMKGN